MPRLRSPLNRPARSLSRALATRWLAWGVGLSSAIAVTASAQPALPALRALAAASPQEIARRLQASHNRVDRLLRSRAAEASKVQQAQSARDAAVASVDTLKASGTRGEKLESALRHALVLDENYSFARSQLIASEGEIAREGAKLLRLYDAALLHKNKAARAMASNDPRRRNALTAYRALAERRDAVRQLLSPVLHRDAGPSADGINLYARPDDDIENLLEKADLARDLEERFLRRAQAVRKRIRQLESERTLAQDVVGMASSDALFDESDRRLVISRGTVRGGPGIAAPIASQGGSEALAVNSRTDDVGPPQAAGGTTPPPPAAPADVPGFAADPSAPEVDEAPGGMDLNNGVDDADGVRAAVELQTPNLPAGITEQGYGGIAGDRALSDWMASGELTLPQLRTLERKLAKEAKRLRGQSKTLRKEVQARTKRKSSQRRKR